MEVKVKTIQLNQTEYFKRNSNFEHSLLGLAYYACYINYLMHNLLKWQNGLAYFKNLTTFATRFLKCVWPDRDIMQGLRKFYMRTFEYSGRTWIESWTWWTCLVPKNKNFFPCFSQYLQRRGKRLIITNAVEIFFLVFSSEVSR